MINKVCGLLWGRDVAGKYILTAFLSLLFLSNLLLAESNEKIWKFCVTGDSRNVSKMDGGINEIVLKRLVTELKNENPEFVLFTGDLVKGNTTGAELEKQLLYWRSIFMVPLLETGISVYPCRGNHDLVGKGREGSKKQDSEESYNVWNKVFSGRFELPQNGPVGEKNITYSVAKNNAEIFCLDSFTLNRKHRVNTKWFERALGNVGKQKNKTHIFLFSHEPAYGVRHKDCLDDYPEQRNKMVNAFAEAGGVAMFFGHDHRYNHAKIKIRDKDIHQFITGTAGAPHNSWNYMYTDSKVTGIADKQCFGYMLVEICGSKATLTMKGWENDGKTQVLDDFEYKLK